MYQGKTYLQMVESIDFLCKHHTENPLLADVARRAGLSEFHFQRVFREWVGISPKRFLQCLALQAVRTRLLTGMPVLDVALDSGLSSTSRVHDLVLSGAGVKPRHLQLQGESLVLTWGMGYSPFGLCVAAHSDWGLTTLLFVENEAEGEQCVRADWPRAQLQRDDHRAQGWLDQAFRPASMRDPASLLLHVRGTNFQLKVWQALLSIPEGRLASYGMLAQGIGSEKAARAVGQAVGSNPLALLIPCHRVINGSGVVGHYRGGTERKRALLAWEEALSSTEVAGKSALE